MKIVIDTDKCAELDISPDVAFYITSMYFDLPFERETFELARLKGFVSFTGFSSGYPLNSKITQEGANTVETLFLNSEINEKVQCDGKEKDRFMVLADKLRELYPQGKKPGTNLQWRDSTVMICRRLKSLMKKYDVEFTDEEAISATKRYIDSFHGDYRFMQVLRYFLWKDDKTSGEETSQFLSYIQNVSDDNNSREDWEATLI